MIVQGKSGAQYQIVCCCENIMFVKFKEPESIITGKITKPIETS